MADRKSSPRSNKPADSFDQARNELFSHILRCGVLKAAVDHQKEWFDDTMDYLADRYAYLTDEELDKLRHLGEMYCRPVINRANDGETSTENDGETSTENDGETTAESEKVGATTT